MPDERHALPEDPLIQYWDGLVQGGPPASTDLDTAVVDAIRRLGSLDDVPAPTPTFVRRLREDLMASPESTRPRASTRDFALTSSLNGQATWPVPGRLPQRSWIFSQVATAALLLLTLVASLMVFGPLRPDDRGRLAILPAVGTSVPGAPVAFVWETKGDSDDPLDDPTYPALDPHGNLWVPDGRNGRFQIFSPDGTLLEIWGEPGSEEGQFNFMESGFGGYGQGAIAFDAEGNFYVVDTGNYRVQKFSPDRRFLSAWGEKGKAEGQFYGVTDIAVDGQGRVYVVDAGRGDLPEEAPAIQVFDANGRFLAAWGEHGSGEGQLIDPIGLAIDRGGNVWVADFGNNRAQQFSPDGAFLTAWGGSGSQVGQFFNLTDVAVDGQGRIWVSDWRNGRVQVFEPDGTFVAAWGNEGKVTERRLTGPNSLVLDGEGLAYVADVGTDTVQKYRLLPPLAP